MSDSTPKQLPPYGLRIPPDLKLRIQVAAVENNRSMHAEIIARLERSFELADAVTPEEASALIKDEVAKAVGAEFADLKTQMAQLLEAAQSVKTEG